MTSKPAHPCNFSRCCKFLQRKYSQAGIKHRDNKLLISWTIWGLGGINIIVPFFDHTQYYFKNIKNNINLSNNIEYGQY